MDAALGFGFASLFIMGWILAPAAAYRNRISIAEWLKDNSLVQTAQQKRKVHLERAIEDAEAELKDIKSKETSPKAE